VLNPDLIPTLLVRIEDRASIPILTPTDPLDHWVRHFIGKTLKWALRVLWTFLCRRLTRREYAKQFRNLLEELGGLWIKVGQLLSLRVDLFSTEFCDELSQLQHRAVGFPTPMARKIIEEDLGSPVDELFDDFLEVPFATASIGQIYRARLKREGVWVALKVQRPFLAVQFRRDQKLISWFVRLFARVPRFRFIRWEEALWELNEIMKEELDYRYEASSLRRMKKTLSVYDIYVPKVFGAYSSRRVLVTEFIHAALMSDFVNLYSADPAKLFHWLQENNIDPKIVAHRLMFSLFRQVFEDNLYHGDLHPGNILLLRDSRVAFIDMGSIGFTETEFLERIKLFTKACATRDFAKAADMSFLLVNSLPSGELEHVKGDVIRVLRAWAARTYVKELPYHEKSMDRILVDVARLMFNNKIAMEWAMLRIRRVFTTLDSALIFLYPDVNYSRLLRDYFMKSERRRLQGVLKTLTPNVVNTLSSVFEFQQRANEYLFHQSAIIRRQAQVFEGTTGKFAYFFKILFGQLAAIEIALAGVFLIAFFHQYYYSWVQPWMGPQIESVARIFPALDYQIWIGLLLLDSYLCITALRLKERFARKENRGTGDSQS